MQTMANVTMTNLENIKGAIAAKIDSASFTSWIAPLNFDIINNTVMHVLLQNHCLAEDSLPWCWIGINNPLVSRSLE